MLIRNHVTMPPASLRANLELRNSGKEQRQERWDAEERGRRGCASGAPRATWRSHHAVGAVFWVLCFSVSGLLRIVARFAPRREPRNMRRVAISLMRLLHFARSGFADFGFAVLDVLLGADLNYWLCVTESRRSLSRARQKRIVEV